MARPDTPRMSVATEDSLIPASCRTRSSRLISRTRSRIKVLRSRVRSRSSRIGCGGTNEPRTRPCAPSSANHWASETSSPNYNDLGAWGACRGYSLRSGAGAGAAGGVGEGGYSEVHGLVAAVADLVHLGEFGAGTAQADFQSFGFAEPAV